MPSRGCARSDIGEGSTDTAARAGLPKGNTGEGGWRPNSVGSGGSKLLIQ